MPRTLYNLHILFSFCFFFSNLVFLISDFLFDSAELGLSIPHSQVPLSSPAGENLIKTGKKLLRVGTLIMKQPAQVWGVTVLNISCHSNRVRDPPITKLLLTPTLSVYLMALLKTFKSMYLTHFVLFCCCCGDSNGINDGQVLIGFPSIRLRKLINLARLLVKRYNVVPLDSCFKSVASR
jgi:hypothetical protein